MVCPASASGVLPSLAVLVRRTTPARDGASYCRPAPLRLASDVHARTRIIAGLSVLVLSGAIVWDLVNDGFWSRHALFTSLVASLIIVATTAADLNELQARQRSPRKLDDAIAGGL
jgi:hypothetical protein